MKIAFRLFFVLLVTLVVFVLAGLAATWAPDKTVQQLSARWAQPPSQFIGVAGMQVHVRDEGPRDDPHPIVLLHGTSSSLHTWEGWSSSLKTQRRVIRFDLPGFGLTGPNPKNDYSMASYVQFVTAVLDRLQVENCVLVGNSLGGQIAWNFAAQEPQRVGQLVLVDAAGYAMISQSVPLGFRLARMPGIRSVLEYVLPRGVVEASLRNVYGDPSKVSAALIDQYMDMALREGNRKALGVRLGQPLGGNEETIKTLTLPTLVVWGGRDRLIPLANGTRFVSDIAGSRLVVLDELGHVPQEEDPQRSLLPLKHFLSIP